MLKFAPGNVSSFQQSATQTDTLLSTSQLPLLYVLCIYTVSDIQNCTTYQTNGCHSEMTIQPWLSHAFASDCAVLNFEHQIYVKTMSFQAAASAEQEACQSPETSVGIVMVPRGGFPNASVLALHALSWKPITSGNMKLLPRR